MDFICVGIQLQTWDNIWCRPSLQVKIQILDHIPKHCGAEATLGMYGSSITTMYVCTFGVQKQWMINYICQIHRVQAGQK
jgi:hypothetical protein